MPDEQWQDLVAVESLEPGDVTAVEFKNTLLAVYDARDGVFVSAAVCTHARANLCDGYFDGRYIECPLHQGLFDIKTGRAKAAPAVKTLKTYPARIMHGKVQIKL